ncbi:hypothetical protein ACFU8W_31470 [Streptomyces sp. NPDC057565]|uniref:hypothetical protein n=1 Tax=Streptomyces sp. NPDC057565 TaxID=3346169 RepID=UPI0036C31D40
MSGDLQVPSEGELLRRIAQRLGDAVEPELVGQMLSEHGLELTGPLPARRELVVHRLYCDGYKSGTDGKDGPFTVDLRLGRGPWAISSSVNSAGKSSLLWALSFALRGEGFAAFRRPETVGWFRYVRADLEVAGVATSVRLIFDRPDHPGARLLAADSVADLLQLDGRDETAPGVHLAASAEPAGVKALIGRFMMDRLGLRTVSVWSAEKNAPRDENGNRDSAEQVHGWSSFFYALALNSASDTLLLGPTTVGQLPVRLMQLFLDVPYAPELSRLSTLQKADAQETVRVARRAKEDADARAQQVEPLRRALDQAQGRLQDLEKNRPDVTALLETVDRDAAVWAARRREHQDALEQLAEARKSRLADQRAARRARQSSAARLLLGALDPEACPRCDHEIDDSRRAAEDSQHRCAICSNVLPAEKEDPQAQAEALARVDDRVVASQVAEETCKQALEAAAAGVEEARAATERSAAELATVRDGAWFARYEETSNEIQQLKGALAVATGGNSPTLPVLAALVTPKAPKTDPEEPTIGDAELFVAAAEILKDVVDSHSRALFSELNDEIVQVAHALGVTNLTSVNLTLGGHLGAVKSGAKHPFASFSPVDRLRMRIAVVVGMIRVSRLRGIMSHPGLLLIDAPTADELTPAAAYQVIETLYRTCEEVSGLQMVITSIEDAVWEIYPQDRIVTGADKRELF